MGGACGWVSSLTGVPGMLSLDFWWVARGGVCGAGP